MKLNVGKRVVLLVHWLLSVIVFLAVVASCVVPDAFGNGVEFVTAALGNSGAEIAGGVFLAVYVIFAVLSIVFILSRKQKDDESGFITVISDDTGKTRIALWAIEQMIRIAVRGIAGIADLKTNIINETESISISVNVVVLSGVHIPTVTSNIKRTISNYIELNCGVSVHEVSVSVGSLETPEDASKRGRKKFGKGLLGTGSAPAAIEDVPVCSDVEMPVAVQEEVVVDISAGDGE